MERLLARAAVDPIYAVQTLSAVVHTGHSDGRYTLAAWIAARFDAKSLILAVHAVFLGLKRTPIRKAG